MKKLLALVLALVMSMSLVTISNAADFADAKDIDNKEAVEVMNAIGVLIGDENGKFNPDANLTRAQAAKIICVMLLGQTAADGLNLKANFSDVSGWAESYIAYCASQGIVAGVGNGKFDPDGQLTGYQFAKMLLVALGYKADLEGMTGADWQVATAKLALNAGLTDGMSIALSKTLTRDEAAKMAFNTLTATMVEYSNGVNVSTSDGTQVTVNAVRNKVGHTTTTGYKAGSNANDEYTQFCEQYFDKLKLTSTTSTDDAFDRPASEWSFKGVKVGTYAKEAAFTYTASASGSTTSAKLSNMGIKGYKLAASSVTAVINGVPANNALTSINDIPGLLGNGTKVEIFVDEDDIETITDVIVIKTQLMQIDRINKSAKTVALKKVDNAGETIAKVGEDDTGYAALSAMKADDYVLVTYVRNSDDNAYVVSSIDVPAAVTGKLTRVSTSNNSVNGVTVAGTAYSLAATKGSAFDGLNNSSIAANKDCTVYVDSYGYAVYIKDVTASTTYIVYADTYSSLVDGKIVNIVSGYDMDGVKITLNVGTVSTSSLAKGAVYSYTTTTDNSADYVINTTAVASQITEIKKSDAQYGGKFYADDVKFLFVSTTTKNSAIDSVDSVSVKSGKQAVAAGVTTYAILNSDNEVTTVVVIGETDVAEGSSVAYVKKFVGYAGKVDSKETYLYDLYIDGELVKGVQSKQNVSANTFVTYEQDGDLYTLKAYTASDKTTSVARWQGVKKANIASDKYIVAGGEYYTMASDAQVIDLTDDNAYGSLGDMKDTNKTFVLDVVYNGNSTSSNYRTINYIFVVSAT